MFLAPPRLTGRRGSGPTRLIDQHDRLYDLLECTREAVGRSHCA